MRIFLFWIWPLNRRVFGVKGPVTTTWESSMWSWRSETIWPYSEEVSSVGSIWSRAHSSSSAWSWTLLEHLCPQCHFLAHILHRPRAIRYDFRASSLSWAVPTLAASVPHLCSRETVGEARLNFDGEGKGRGLLVANLFTLGDRTFLNKSDHSCEILCASLVPSCPPAM